MNYRIITSAVLALSLSSFAGQAYFIFKKDSTYTAGLLGIDSLNFPKDRRGETDSLFIAGYGLKAFDRVPLANTEVSFKTDYYDAEKLSVNVQSGPRVGSFLFYLRDVEYIDFVKANGYFNYRRNEQSKYWMYESINEHLRLSFYNNPLIRQSLQHAEQSVLGGEQTSFTAAQQLLDLYYNDLKNFKDLNAPKEK